MARQNESRQKILEAAERVFAEKGYFIAGTDEIAQAAGVAKGTLYYNFKSKGEIFETLVTEGLEDLHRQVEESLNTDFTVQEHVRRLIRIHIRYASNFPELTRIFLNELSAGLEKQVRLRVAALRERYIGGIVPLIEEGQKLGIIREGDPRFIAMVVTSVLNSLGSTGPTLSGEEEVALLEKILLHGLLPGGDDV